MLKKETKLIGSKKNDPMELEQEDNGQEINLTGIHSNNKSYNLFGHLYCAPNHRVNIANTATREKLCLHANETEQNQEETPLNKKKNNPRTFSEHNEDDRITKIIKYNNDDNQEEDIPMKISTNSSFGL